MRFLILGASRSGSSRLSSSIVRRNEYYRRAPPPLGSSIGTDSSMIAANDRICEYVHLARGGQRRHFAAGKGDSESGERKESVDKAAMEDEYGDMKAEGKVYRHPTPYRLENGSTLRNAQLCYMTYGTLNENTRDNVLVVCHALTGNASLHSWWGGLLGDGLAFDTRRYFVVCCNILGSCYGSTGPSTHPDFPDVSVQDTVRLQLQLLIDQLNIASVKCVIGGSFGGMQAIEYAVQAGTLDNPYSASPFVRSVVPLACGAAHTAWQIAISEVQRQAIYADPNWNSSTHMPWNGLSVARQIGMISYRTALGYDTKFGRRLQTDPNSLKEGNEDKYGSNVNWQVKSYLEYQGRKFQTRFDPITYVKLTEQMDSHDVGRNRGGKEAALSRVVIPALVLGIDSDILYPLREQEELTRLLPNGKLGVITSDAGHDGFLLEQDQVAAYITDFLNSIE